MIEQKTAPPAGWYSNPDGNGQRYWDGTQWTEHYQQNAVPVSAKPKSRGFFKTFAIVTGAILTAAVLLIGGCTALLGAGANEVGREMDRAQQRNAIPSAGFEALRNGEVTKDEILRRYGQPESVNEADNGGEFLDLDCTYWNKKDGEVGDGYQLCFETDGRLESKDSWTF